MLFLYPWLPSFSEFGALGNFPRGGVALEDGQGLVRSCAKSCVDCEDEPLKALRQIAVDP